MTSKLPKLPKLKDQKITIIGSGPGGHTAALYASRGNLSPVVFEGLEPGGQLTTTTDVENYPGFPQGVMGPELMDLFKKQAQRFGAHYIQDSIVRVDFSTSPFTLWAQEEGEFRSQTVIVATGARAKYLGLPEEKGLIGRGVSSCATCDGPFFRGKVVHIVGGGDTAMEESSFLSKFASSVTIIHRRDSLRASQVMQERVLKNPKINIIWSQEVRRIHSDSSGVTGIDVEDLKTKKIETRPTDGLFMGIGHLPNTDFLKGHLKLNAQGFILTSAPHPDTNVPGVFACGDVQDPHYRQAITAAGSGCTAAMRAEEFLEKNS